MGREWREGGVEGKRSEWRRRGERRREVRVESPLMILDTPCCCMIILTYCSCYKSEKLLS